jgi:hypothetical protein
MENDSENRPQEFQRAVDGYLRKSDVFKTVGALVGLFGAFFGAWGIIDRMDESLRMEIRNERTERINADNQIRLELYQRRR